MRFGLCVILIACGTPIIARCIMNTAPALRLWDKVTVRLHDKNVAIPC